MQASVQRARRASTRKIWGHISPSASNSRPVAKARTLMATARQAREFVQTASKASTSLQLDITRMFVQTVLIIRPPSETEPQIEIKNQTVCATRSEMLQVPLLEAGKQTLLRFLTTHSA